VAGVVLVAPHHHQAAGAGRSSSSVAGAPRPRPHLSVRTALVVVVSGGRLCAGGPLLLLLVGRLLLCMMMVMMSQQDMGAAGATLQMTGVCMCVGLLLRGTRWMVWAVLQSDLTAGTHYLGDLIVRLA
jgi:hypothetical protein